MIVPQNLLEALSKGYISAAEIFRHRWFLGRKKNQQQQQQKTNKQKNILAIE